MNSIIEFSHYVPFQKEPATVIYRVTGEISLDFLKTEWLGYLSANTDESFPEYMQSVENVDFKEILDKWTVVNHYITDYKR